MVIGPKAPSEMETTKKYNSAKTKTTTVVQEQKQSKCKFPKDAAVKRNR